MKPLALALSLLALLTGCVVQPTAPTLPRAHSTAAVHCAVLPPAPASLPIASTTTVVETLASAPLTLEEPAYVTTVTSATTLYDAALTPVATLQRSLGWEPDIAQPVVIVNEDERCGTALILTAVRGVWDSVASTVATVRTSELAAGRTPAEVVTVDLSDASITVRGVVSPVVIGSEENATPTGVGYILSSYADPAQPATDGEPIALTSLHSTATESFAGNTGEIGLHYSLLDAAGGSHGCVRVPREVARELGAMVGAVVVVQE